MDFDQESKRSVASDARPAAACMLFASAFLLACFAVCVRTGVPFSSVCRDPLAVAESIDPVRWYFGSLSNLGVLAWWTGASVAFFRGLETRGPGRAFFLWATCVTTSLAVDDLFQVHDRIVPSLAGGYGDSVVCVHIVLLAVWVTNARTWLFRTNLVIFAAALFMLTSSVVIDVFLRRMVDQYSVQVGYFLEDGTKFIGIMLWATYLTHTALSNAASSEASAEKGDDKADET